MASTSSVRAIGRVTHTVQRHLDSVLPPIREFYPLRLNVSKIRRLLLLGKAVSNAGAEPHADPTECVQ